MVRLLQVGQTQEVKTNENFQSHNGAIAAKNPKSMSSRLATLSIPQWCDCCDEIKRSHPELADAFNPTMVRLLHENYEVRAPLPHFFQSHNGAIAAQPLLSPHSPIIRLSIPQWCDCCQIKKAWVKLGDGLSIPQWCDCCCYNTFLNQVGKLTFNPTMVRLLRSLPLPLGLRELDFQSHNGAIAASEFCCRSVCRLLLSIPQWCDCCPNCRLLPLPSGRTFNPTMVRLLHIPPRISATRYLAFQSHNGAIAACPALVRRRESHSFQSHNGAIAAVGTSKYFKAMDSFQSHNGAIAASLHFYQRLLNSFFQSHNGAIAAVLSTGRIGVGSWLSIPQWCDCCAEGAKER